MDVAGKGNGHKVTRATVKRSLFCLGKRGMRLKKAYSESIVQDKYVLLFKFVEMTTDSRLNFW